MRRTVIVLIISTVLLWGSTALGRRPPTTRWDGDPDEYQAKVFHDETSLRTWDLACRSGGQKKTGRVWFEPGTSVPGAGVPGARATWITWLRLSQWSRSRDPGRLLWEVLFPGKKHRYSGEGR